MGAVSDWRVGCLYGCRRYGINSRLLRMLVARYSAGSRRLAAGVTGSTRNCSANRRLCRGAWRLARRSNFPPVSGGYAVPSDISVRVVVEPAGCGFVAWLGRKGVLKLGADPVAVRALLRYRRLFIEMFLRIDTSEMLWGVRIPRGLLCCWFCWVLLVLWWLVVVRRRRLLRVLSQLLRVRSEACRR